MPCSLYMAYSGSSGSNNNINVKFQILHVSYVSCIIKYHVDAAAFHAYLDHANRLFYRSHILKFPDRVEFKTAVFIYIKHTTACYQLIYTSILGKDISVITRLKIN